MPLVGELLRAAFLRGETVVATYFAQTHAVSRQGVSDALARMAKRGLLSSEQAQRTGRYLPPVTWTCIDRAGMEVYETRVVGYNPMVERRRLTAIAAPLLDAWGIRLVEIDLPATRHLMLVCEDEVEAA